MTWSLKGAASLIRNAGGQLANEGHQVLRQLIKNRGGHQGQPVLQELHQVGFTALPAFVTRERCADLIARIDAGLERYADFVQRDPVGSDCRLFGLDAVDPEIHRIAFDPFAITMLQQYQRAASYDGFALCARLLAKSGNKGSGQGWHRDSAAYKQVKLMVYLNDVDETNGPFQYLVGSHRPLDVVRSTARYGYSVNQHRYSDAEIGRLLDAEPRRLRTITAPAGTALLFDSRGLHRGMPIASGSRYAITTYLWFNMPAAAHVKAWTIESQQKNGRPT